MSKKIWFKLLIALSMVAVSVVWLLSVLMPDKFEKFNAIWLITAFAGIMGIAFILKGLFSKTLTFAKKFYIFFGANKDKFAKTALKYGVSNFLVKEKMSDAVFCGFEELKKAGGGG